MNNKHLYSLKKYLNFSAILTFHLKIINIGVSRKNSGFSEVSIFAEFHNLSMVTLWQSNQFDTMKEKENNETATQVQPAAEKAPETISAPPVSEESLVNTILRQPGVAMLLAGIAAGKCFEDAVRDLNIPPKRKEPTTEQMNELMQKLNIAEENREEFSRLISETVAGDDLKAFEMTAKGLFFEKVCAEREQKAYLKGRNEKIKLEKEAVSNPFKPIPEPDEKKAPDFYFHSPRKSVWDD